MIVYRVLHGTAPSYLSEQLRYIADMPDRTHLRLSSTSLLDVRPSLRVTVGDRSFAKLVPGSGTLSLVMLLLQHRCCHFVEY